jgi:hypothetical protein
MPAIGAGVSMIGMRRICAAIRACAARMSAAVTASSAGRLSLLIESELTLRLSSSLSD